MPLTETEKALYEKVLIVLDKRSAQGALQKNDFTTEEILQLLRSKNPDLTIVGTDVLSLMPEKPDAHYFIHDEKAARNYVRYKIATKAADYEGFKLFAQKDLDQPAFHSHYHDFSSRLDAAHESNPPTTTPPNLTVIVHGTWASTSTWWMPKGNFWQYINNITKNVYSGPNPFSWTGNNNHADRMQGAQDLVQWATGQTYQYLDLIAHSHGGNVCLHASRLGLKIRKLVLLGTPIRLEYLPDLKNIEVIYNIYSTADLVQGPGTFPNRRYEGRSLADGERITNYSAVDDGSGKIPGHSDLHEPATWNANKFDQLL
jgi:hypothetical protein